MNKNAYNKDERNGMSITLKAISIIVSIILHSF
jgi:hypothetical protein